MQAAGTAGARSLLAGVPGASGNEPDDSSIRGKSTYADILKSSVLIGGSSAINLAIGLVRTKVMAVLLGPAGFGLMAALTSIADITRSVAELGINNSGVRQIAEAVASKDSERIACTVTVLRRTAWLLGVLGALALLVLCRRVSEVTFGDDRYAGPVAVLSLAVFFRLVADGQGALIQGMRRIRELATINVLGALLGTAVSIPLLYWLREDGVAPSLVAVAAVSATISWWYSRKILVGRPALAASEVAQQAMALLRLGFAFMASGFLMLGAVYVVRIILIRHDGLAAAGLYQSAWTIGGLYVGFVLQAMSTDFYPRLVGVVNDPAECNRVVNEQAHVSLLLSASGVIATLAFAPLVVSMLYSAEFEGASETLRWVCLGMSLRVITWPMGYIIVAKGEQTLFFATELAWALVNISLTWACVNWFGLTGAGIAFCASYVFHGLMIYPIVRRLTGFRWTPSNLRLGTVFLMLIGLVFASFYLLPQTWASSIGAVVLLVSGVHAFHALLKLAPTGHVPRRILRLLPRGKSRP